MTRTTSGLLVAHVVAGQLGSILGELSAVGLGRPVDLFGAFLMGALAGLAAAVPSWALWRALHLRMRVSEKVAYLLASPLLVWTVAGIVRFCVASLSFFYGG